MLQAVRCTTTRSEHTLAHIYLNTTSKVAGVEMESLQGHTPNFFLFNVWQTSHPTAFLTPPPILYTSTCTVHTHSIARMHNFKAEQKHDCKNSLRFVANKGARFKEQLLIKSRLWLNTSVYSFAEGGSETCHFSASHITRVCRIEWLGNVKRTWSSTNEGASQRLDVL